jgi:mono/diheme cytochrome c family protein
MESPPVTEIPEHLLKRSKERRSALGLGGETEAAAGAAVSAATSPSTASVPAVVGAAAPATQAGGAAPPAAPPAVPKAAPIPVDPPVVLAAKQRKKIPWWALAVAAPLPFWAFLFMEAMSPPVVEAEGRLAAGEELYASKACSNCHGANGAGSDAGGVGRPLWEGEVLLTFPRFEDQVAFIRPGSFAAGTPYGNPARPGGQHVALGGMPNFPNAATTALELTEIVCHVRITLSGEAPDTEEALRFCAEDSTEVVEASDEGTDIEVVEAEE